MVAVGVPPAPRRKDVALAFIMERIARTGRPPGDREIARELGVSKTRVQALKEQLRRDGAIDWTPGVQLSLRVLDDARCRAELTLVLRRLGFVDPLALPQDNLPMLPELEHLPELDWAQSELGSEAA